MVETSADNLITDTSVEMTFFGLDSVKIFEIFRKVEWFCLIWGVYARFAKKGGCLFPTHSFTNSTQGGVSVCNLQNHSPDHYLLQNFQCGESTIRVVLCENGFNFFKQVSNLKTKYR